MLRPVFLSLTLCFATPLNAGELFDTWGNIAQCSRQPLIEGGSLLAAPFEISENWLKQRDLWCALTWFPTTNSATGSYTRVRALCGEDSQRGYWLSLVYARSNDQLTLIWDETLENGPLNRCNTS